MTFSPSTMPSSAVELHDDDGRLVATLYARDTSIEVVAASGVELDSSIDMATRTDRLQVTLTRAEERRR